ncbi:hypothetical protein BO71DRAFT_447120 [Aspergillus ellipticus CBS 707.79]|uniref:Condensation domain-containing protein n=1 Tax=Aspergillus ellipticus CBS 707.79 TaxID=1448320 RepID=A0A319DLU7_9EURO|nr:hypothetical protein BO71DRAFT_447120 [Aspergillus ellipticus CBS 707.79]
MGGMEPHFAFVGAASGALCDGRQQCTIFSKLKVDIDVGDHPQIAATVEGMNKVYEAPDEAALQEWLASTFIVSSASDADEVYHSAAPIKQATLYYVPKSSELLFRVHHFTIDGIGMLLLCHSYLSALAAPAKDLKFGDEYTRLAPTIEEALGYTTPTSEQIEKAGRDFMSWAVNAPGIGPVSKVGAVAAGEYQNTELVFPTQTTEAIIKACKDKGISVTSAVHAAYIRAIVKYADPSSQNLPYVTANLFNLRPYVLAPYNTSQSAASVYFTPYPYKLDLPASFWESAQALNRYYKNLIKDDPEILNRTGTLTNIVHTTAQSPDLGIAEQYLRRTYGSNVTVRDLSKVGVDVVLGMSMFFIYTFQDQLLLVYSFNDGYEEASNIDAYLEEMQRVLAEELLA